MHLECYGIFIDHFGKRLLQIISVKEFWR